MLSHRICKLNVANLEQILKIKYYYSINSNPFSFDTEMQRFKDIDDYLRKLDWFAISTYLLAFRVVSKRRDMQYVVAIPLENRVVRFVLSSKKSRILGLREVLDLPLYVETQGEFYLVSGTTKLPKRKYLCAGLQPLALAPDSQSTIFQ